MLLSVLDLFALKNISKVMVTFLGGSFGILFILFALWLLLFENLFDNLPVFNPLNLFEIDAVVSSNRVLS